MSKDIIILGSGITHVACPYDREVWGVNAILQFPEFAERKGNKIFFFDSLVTMPPHVLTIQHLEDTAGIIEPITTPNNFLIMKKHKLEATVYPLGAITKKFKSSYFANTIAYMIAYAMYEEVRHILVYGTDHLSYQSYIMERSCLEYWLGRAQQSGITVEIAEDSAVLKTFNGKLYGYEFFYDENTKPEEDFVLCEDSMIK